MRAACLVAVIAGLVSWTAARANGPTSHLIGFDTYMASHQSFEATRLDRLDPRTLRPVAGASLKLGDAASSVAFDPSRHTLAVGGVNFGNVMLIDPVRLRRVATIAVQRSRDDIEVDPIAWPRPRTLVAIVGPPEGKYLMPQRIAIVDPVARRVRRTRAVRGTVIGWARTGGRTAILATTAFGRVAPARLIVVGPGGRLRSVLLRGIAAGAGVSGRVAQWRSPGIAALARRAFVVGGTRVATVDLASLTVRYRSISGVLRPLPPVPPSEPGSSGVYRGMTRGVRSVGAGRLLVTGYDSEPVGRRYLERQTTYETAIVDTRTWRVAVRFKGAFAVEPAFGVWLGNGTQWSDKRESGFPLIAYRPDGSILWRRRTPSWWALAGGMLVAGNPDGSWLAQLDPRTGALERVLGRSLAWPLEPFAWRS